MWIPIFMIYNSYQKQIQYLVSPKVLIGLACFRLSILETMIYEISEVFQQDKTAWFCSMSSRLKFTKKASAITTPSGTDQTPAISLPFKTAHTHISNGPFRRNWPNRKTFNPFHFMRKPIDLSEFLLNYDSATHETNISTESLIVSQW